MQQLEVVGIGTIGWWSISCMGGLVVDVSSFLNTSDRVGGEGEPMEMKFPSPMVKLVK